MVTEKSEIQITDSQTSEEGIERLFNESFYTEFRSRYFLSNLESCRNSCIKNMLVEATESYRNAQSKLENQVPENLENLALEKVCASASELYDALIDLIDVGNADAKLKAEIGKFSEHSPDQTQRLLYDLQQRHPSQSVFYFRQLLMDLLIASENAQNMHPRQFPKVDGFTEVDPEATREKHLAVWKDRRRKNKVSRQRPLTEFIYVWHKFWAQNSAIPFTEGRYVKELGTTKSLAVDAIQEVMNVLDTSVTRSAIVSALKKAKHIPVE